MTLALHATGWALAAVLPRSETSIYAGIEGVHVQHPPPADPSQAREVRPGRCAALPSGRLQKNHQPSDHRRFVSVRYDADGGAFRSVVGRSGVSKPMRIEFAVHVPDQARGNEIAQLAAPWGYVTTVEWSAPRQRWTCYCAKHMAPTYEAIMAAQKELEELSEPLGGHSDGWGTSGNL